MEQKPLIYFEGEKEVYFFGVIQEHLGEEDFGLYFKYLRKQGKWLVKGTWDENWRLLTEEEFHQEIRDLYKTLEELEEDARRQEQADKEAEEKYFYKEEVKQ